MDGIRLKISHTSVHNKQFHRNSNLPGVGVAGFEPTASSTPCWRATRLRYTPILPKFQSKFANSLTQFFFK